jgi:hypothetical protein
MIVGTDRRVYGVVASDAAPIPRTAGGDCEPDEHVLPRSPCPRSAGVRARGSAERGQAHAYGSARTGRVARDGAQHKGARREALTGRVALGARAHGGAEAHDDAMREGARREGVRDAWRGAQGSAAARKNRGRG